MRRVLAGLVGAAMVCGAARGQVAAPDAGLAAARGWIGRALFVRGFYGANELKYDAAGRVDGAPKVVDWTLAGMDVQTVERKGPGVLELDGVRVAIRYNPDNRFFERHPQKDERMKVLVGTGADAVEKTLGAVFSVGIDPAMQRAMPEFWRHYFDPKLPWAGADALEGQMIYGVPGQPVAVDLVFPAATHKAEAGFSVESEHDRVQGTVGMRVVVDAAGMARRVTVVRPVGYGLDARAAEGLGKWRFNPGRLKGVAVASAVELSEEFVLVPMRR